MGVLKKLLKIFLYLVAIAVAIPILVLLIGFIGALFTKHIFFRPDNLESILFRKPYTYSFCKPDLSKITDVCSASATDPHNGEGFYHFYLNKENSGVLPPGLTLHANGLLTGTPNAVGQTAVSICAEDESKLTDCQTVQMTVK